MAGKFIRIELHESERADETWVNPDHVVAVTPDKDQRYMTIVLDVFDASGFSWSAKVYRATWESGQKLLDS